MVAGKEAQRRDRYRAEQLPHLAVEQPGDWISTLPTTNDRTTTFLAIPYIRPMDLWGPAPSFAFPRGKLRG